MAYKNKHVPDAFIYVIEFNNGSLKVGVSDNPELRLKAHASAAKRFGLVVSKSWVSAKHRFAWDNERLLIKFCRESAGAVTIQAETFLNVGFNKVVAYAKRFDMRPSTNKEIEEGAQESKDAVKALAGMLFPGVSTDNI